MELSGSVARRAQRHALSCAFVLLGLFGLAAGCGAPDQTGMWFDRAECATADDCDDADKCTIDKCVESKCAHSDVNLDDSNVCTIDKCDPMTGISHNPMPVDDNNICTNDVCDPATGVSHTPVKVDDDDLCTMDACSQATGVTHTPVTIDDGDNCTIDACNSANGVVSHTPVDVDDNDVCTTDTCDAATGMPVHTAVNVNDGNGCTIDACDPVTGPSHTPKPPCSQELAESCNFVLCDHADGLCKSKDAAFQDDFANNAAGWTLDMQWEIKNASSSSGQTFGNPDPAQDFDGSGAGDNGVAGVKIGGNAASTGGSTYYLTSPEIDLSSLPASENVYLDFWRWLNMSAPPAMQSNIEVWNGNSWVQIWANGAAVTDPAWQNFTYNVTSYKGAAFRVRFGLKVMNGAPTVSSWNIDHVRLIRHFDQGC